MTKNKLTTIFAVIAAVLVVALTAGLLAHFFAKDGKIEETPEVLKTAGKVYDGARNELNADSTYAMPTSVVFSPLYAEPVATSLGLPPMSVNISVSHDFEFNNIKIDWESTYADGGDASAAVKVTPTVEGSSTAKLECLSAFSKQITITANVRGNEDNKATCTVDYVKRLNNMTDFSPNGTDFDDPNGADFCVEFSEGTITPDIYIDRLTFNFKSEFAEAVNSYLTFNVELISHSFVNQKCEISNQSNKILASQDTCDKYEWSWVIKDFDNFDEAHKKAIYYAWYHAYCDMGYFASNFTVDVTISAQYNGNYFGGVEETEFIGNGNMYLSGEQYGGELEPSLSFNTNVTF